MTVRCRPSWGCRPDYASACRAHTGGQIRTVRLLHKFSYASGKHPCGARCESISERVVDVIGGRPPAVLSHQPTPHVLPFSGRFRPRRAIMVAWSYCIALSHTSSPAMQTSWEFLRGHTINYISAYHGLSVSPFDRGVLGNLSLVFLKPHSVLDWPLARRPQDEGYQEPPFNWCDNEYYSCC